MELPVLFATLVIFIGTFHSMAYVPLAAFLAPRDQVGWLLSLQGMSSFVALVPVGLAVDRLGSVHVLKWGLALMAASLLLTCASQSLQVQLAGRTLNGLAAAANFNAGVALLMERYQEPRRAQHIGLVLGIGTLGNLVGPPLAGFALSFSESYGVERPQVLALLPAAALLALSYLLLPKVAASHAEFEALDSPLLQEEGKEEDAAPNTGSVPLQSPLPPEVKKEEDSYLMLFFGVYVAAGVRAWVVAAELACLFGAGSAILCAGVVEMRLRGVSAVVIGLATVPAGVLQAIMSWWGGWQIGQGAASAKSDKRVELMVCCPVALAAGMTGVVLASLLDPEFVVLPVVAALGMTAAAYAAVDAATISTMAELAASHGRGRGEAVTATELAVCLGQGLGPGIGLMAAKYLGFQGLCLGVAAASLSTGVACALVLRREVRREAPAS